MKMEAVWFWVWLVFCFFFIRKGKRNTNSFQACEIQKTREFQGLFFPFLIAETNCMYPSSPPGTSMTELKGLKLHCYS